MSQPVRSQSGRIVAGFLAPHPPHLVYSENPPQNKPRSRGGWETLRWAYEHCRKSIQRLQPDVLIVHSPHWQTRVGYHFLAVPQLSGLSVDPIFPHLFQYQYAMDIDVELAQACCLEAEAEGLLAKQMINPAFRVDYGTIVSLHMLNPTWDIPVLAISANHSPYFFSDAFAQEQTIKLGQATQRAIEKTGRRAVVVASNTLSHLHFDREPEIPEDMSQESIYSAAQYEWDMRVIQLLRAGRVQELLAILPDFVAETSAEIKAGSLLWMLSAMNFPKVPAQLHGYAPVIGTGNAVMEWNLSPVKDHIISNSGLQRHFQRELVECLA